MLIDFIWKTIDGKEVIMWTRGNNAPPITYKIRNFYFNHIHNKYILDSCSFHCSFTKYFFSYCGFSEVVRRRTDEELRNKEKFNV